MDDEDEAAGGRRNREKSRRGAPQYKYKDMLQGLADRDIDEIVIDLDDLATVRPLFISTCCGLGSPY